MIFSKIRFSRNPAGGIQMSESWEKKTNLTNLCIKGLLMVVHLLIAHPNLNSVFD